MHSGKRWLTGVGICFGLVWGQAQAQGLKLLTESYPPFNFEENAQVSGMATDVVRELFKRANIPYTITLVPWVRAFNTAVMENNTCVYSTTRTENREHQFKWIGPLVDNPWVLYAGPHSPRINPDLESARPYKIGGYNGDAVAQYLIARGFNVELTPNDELNPRKLDAGRIDFWATGKYLGSYEAKQQKLTTLKPVLVFNTAFMYLACNPGVSDQTVFALNSLLQKMQQDGAVARLSKRYLP